MRRFFAVPLCPLRPFRVPGLRVRCLNADGVLSVDLTRTRSGKTRTRAVGFRRGRLTLDEASALLQRPRREVGLYIRAGFLRARRTGGRRYVTLQACVDFLFEEQYDLATCEGRPKGPTIPAEEVFRQLDELADEPDEHREPPRMPSVAERQAAVRSMLRPLARSLRGATFGELIRTAARRQARKHLRAERAERRRARDGGALRAAEAAGTTRSDS